MTATEDVSSIDDLLRQGQPLDAILECGFTRDDVMAVLREHQWDLDVSGRLPRNKRVTSPPGLRTLPPPAPPRPRPLAPPPARKKTPTKRAASPASSAAPGTAPEPSGPVDGRAGQGASDAPVVPSVIPAGHRRGKVPLPREHGTLRGYRQHINRDDMPICTPCREAYNADRSRAKARQSRRAQAFAVDLDVWFADAQRSPDRAVRQACAVAISAFLALRIAMDDLARAERAATARPLTPASARSRETATTPTGDTA